MSNHLSPRVAHSWAICASCGDRRWCHARKVGGQFPVPVCNRRGGCVRVLPQPAPPAARAAYRNMLNDLRGFIT